MSQRHILAIDQGTTSTRAFLFDDTAKIVAVAQREFDQHYPADGWVEHDPEQIWADTQAVMRDALADAALSPEAVAAIGITNQRETTVLWDRATGEPLGRAIVWQDRRTAEFYARLQAEGHEALVAQKTGLLLDPYFSATQLRWLLDNIDGARVRAEAGELAFGTIDCFLLWRLTGGAVHATDATNASRTLLFDIHEQRWCPALLELFDIPEGLLPEVRDSSGSFGQSDLLGPAIPIAGIAGDQQAALVGQACFAPGEGKATYGTGSFILLNCGDQAIASENRLLTTTAYRLDGVAAYASEGSIFVAGAGVKWLRDGLGMVGKAGETEQLAASVPDNGGVYIVPGFVGLGAPHWRPEARGLICGLTLGSRRAHVARAMLEAVAYQTSDLIDAMVADGAQPPEKLRVDGGMAANDWFCQFLADLLDVAVERPDNLETTALGAAFLAGMAVGIWDGPDAVAALPRAVDRFEPALDADRRAALLKGWHMAVERALL